MRRSDGRLQALQLGDAAVALGAGSGSEARPPPAAAGDKPVAVVSNHVSWCDILIHMSRYFPAFAAREQTKNMPLVGVIR